MNLPRHLVIDGRPASSRSNAPLSLVNPATEEVWAEVESAGAAEIDRAVTGAHRIFEEGWRDLAPGPRADLLFQIAALIRREKEELAALESRNVGKPLTDARDEILLGARVFEYYAGAVGKFYGNVIPVARGGLDFTLRQPLGVVGAIVPWNFPFPIACWKVAPAPAAGNSVVLKPAHLTPLTALRLGELALEAGLPAGVLQVVPGTGGEAGAALAQHRLVRKISFTGSTEVGVRLMAGAAPQLKRISLELGGKSPNIIFADADLEAAAARSPLSVFANAGQDCCARSRIFVEKPVFEEFLERFVVSVKALSVGDPSREETQIGPLITREHRSGVEQFLEHRAGARILCGGDRPQDRGWYLNPAVVVDFEVENRLWREEVFGPVVCVRPFTDETSLIEEVNASPYGLSGSIWTSQVSRALRVARRIESGVLSINSHSSVHVEAPFGGMKMSGIGRDLGMTAMEGYTELKNIYIAEESSPESPKRS